jgi:hypothetical protein
MPYAICHLPYVKPTYILFKPIPIPSSVTVKHVAVAVKADSRAAVALSSAVASWRTAFRMHDVQEFRGGDVALPEGILRAYLALLDYWAEGVPNTITALEVDPSTGPKGRMGSADNYSQLVTCAAAYARAPLQVPGAGFFAMRCVHSASDAQRLSILADCVGEGGGGEGEGGAVMAVEVAVAEVAAGVGAGGTGGAGGIYVTCITIIDTNIHHIHTNDVYTYDAGGTGHKGIGRVIVLVVGHAGMYYNNRHNYTN